MTCQCNWARCCVTLAPTPLRLAMSQLVLKSQLRNIFQAMCCYIQISNCVVPAYMVGTQGQFSLQQQKSKVEQHCLPAPLRRPGARAKAAHGTMNINQQLGADMANSCKKYAPPGCPWAGRALFQNRLLALLRSRTSWALSCWIVHKSKSSSAQCSFQAN